MSPQARAYALLNGIHFEPDLDRSYYVDRSHYRTGGHPRPQIQFCWTGGNRFIRWVTASDLVALSLLQGRLIDLGMPIKIVEGTYRCTLLKRTRCLEQCCSIADGPT